MLKNVYTGKECILGLHGLYQKMIYELLESLNIIEKSDNSYYLPGVKDTLNMYDKSKPVTIIYSRLDVHKTNKIIIDILGNYIYNRFYYERSNPIDNIFARLANKMFKVDYIDGMSLVDKRLGGIPLIDEMFNIDILFIKVRVGEANYKNYHLTINDVIRARECKNLTTIIFFKGSRNDAAKLEYLELDPREINLLGEEQPLNKTNRKKETHTYTMNDDVLGG